MSNNRPDFDGQDPTQSAFGERSLEDFLFSDPDDGHADPVVVQGPTAATDPTPPKKAKRGRKDKSVASATQETGRKSRKPRRASKADTATSGLSDGPGKQRREKRSSSRRTSSKSSSSGRSIQSGPGRRFGLIAFALTVTTFLAAVVLLGQAPEPDKTYVVRFTRDIAAGMTVPATAFEATAIDPELADPGAVSAPDVTSALAIVLEGADGSAPLAEKRLRQPVYQGQQVHPSMFSAADIIAADGLAADERLISVSASVATAVAGSLSAGDDVDVVAVSSSGVAVTVAQGVRVVAVTAGESTLRAAEQAQASDGGQELSATDLLPSNPIPGVYTLQVPSSVVAALAAADASADIYLLSRTDGADELPILSDLTSFGCSLAEEMGQKLLGICSNAETAPELNDSQTFPGTVSS